MSSDFMIFWSLEIPGDQEKILEMWKHLYQNWLYNLSYVYNIVNDYRLIFAYLMMKTVENALNSLDIHYFRYLNTAGKNTIK